MKIVITGGGTGGHIYPALAVASTILSRNSNLEVRYVGTKKGLEAKIIPEHGLPFKAISAAGLKRKASLENLVILGVVGVGFCEAFFYLLKEKPQVAVGTGGYVSVPLILAAKTLGIPTVILEQNTRPGIATKVLGKIASRVCVSFAETMSFFPADKVILTGNPIRAEIAKTNRQEARKQLNLPLDKTVILVFGASQGAQKINESILELLELAGENDWVILHITGRNFYEKIKEKAEVITKNKKISYHVYPYMDNMALAYGSADLVVCRSGATTLAEITVVGLPAILVPYPYATDNHQEHNARMLEKKGGARVVLDKDLTGQILKEELTALVNDKNYCEQLSKSCRNFGRAEAVDKITDLIISLANKTKEAHVD